MTPLSQAPSRRGWRVGALLVGVATAAGLLAWGVAPWLATLVGATPVLLVLACAIPCLLPLVLLRRSGGCGEPSGKTAAAAAPGRCEASPGGAAPPGHASATTRREPRASLPN